MQGLVLVTYAKRKHAGSAATESVVYDMAAKNFSMVYVTSILGAVW